ncbi:MAG: carbohydrate ABC transporter permease [Silicimonas sp.]|jgi:lactose/L-arabinose transport system permease protein|uniref:carbohydrate ABC transporter permease n=1 Tax=Alphaproteobacteria TaxID=28211 RepID=UPI0032EED04C
MTLSRAQARRRAVWAMNLLVWPLALLWLFPLWAMLVFATMPDSAIFSPETLLWPSDQFINNFNVLEQNAGFTRTMINSVVAGLIYASLSVLLTSMAGWALACYRFVGKVAVTALLLGTMTLPFFVVVIPQFILVAREFNLANTWFALIVPPLFNSLGVLFMRQAFLMMPRDLFDAARVEGVSEWRIYFFVGLPLARPMLAALAIIMFLFSWNNYLWPLLINTQTEMMTAPVALGSLIGVTRVSWGGIMAGAIILTVPMLILFVALQRHFVSGIAAGAVK